MTEFRPSMGRWWLPGEPEKQVAGYLELVPEDQALPWQLSLEGGLHDWDAKRDPADRWAGTLHGNTSYGPCTLVQALPRGQQAFSRSEGPSTERWGAQRLITGTHHEDDAKYHWATFRLPHLWHWIGPSMLNRYAAPRPDPEEDADDPREHTAQLDDGQVLDLCRVYERNWSATEEGKRGHALYRLTSDSGFTLERLDEVTYALALLHSLVTNQRMDTFALRLGVRDEERWPSIEDVDAHPPAGHDWEGLRDPFLDTGEIEFEAFIKEWLRVFKESSAIAAAFAPRRIRLDITTILVDGCNAVEALATLLWRDESPQLRPEDDRVLEVLREGRINSKVRKDIQDHLRQKQWTLASKLERLAESIGPDSARWLVGPSTKHWAEVTARLRNSLAHGFKMKGSLSEDQDFIITASETLMAVARLGLLRAVGYTNPLAKTPHVELLVSRETSVACHHNSDLFHQLEGVAERAQDWTVWHKRMNATAERD